MTFSQSGMVRTQAISYAASGDLLKVAGLSMSGR
jgi:hypothetical protein